MKHGNLIPKTGAHVPEDKDQKLVLTPYGRGTVIRSQRDDGIQEVELTDWTAATTGRRVPTMIYTSTEFPSVEPEVGSDVLCTYGRGRVVDVRPTHHHQQVVVRLSSWRLAGRSLVTCYLQKSAVAVVRPQQVHEMSVVERVERAMELKEEAAALFQQKDYDGALNVYARAVDAVKYVQHKADSSNVVRADLLVVMVTCSNNSGTCCIRLRQWEIASRYAKQALSLLEAMEKKKGMRIHTEMNKSGLSDAKVFGEWQVKSYMILASALVEKGEADSAMEKIKTARDIVSRYSANKQVQLKDKELVKLYNKYKERRKTLLDREKQRAKAMFANSNKENVKHNGKNGDTKLPNKKNGKKEAVNENNIPWHQNPSVLAGLCGAVGILGFGIIIASQVVFNKKKRI